MKKLVVLSASQIDYVQSIAKCMDPQNKKGNFSKALRKIIDDYHGRQI